MRSLPFRAIFLGATSVLALAQPQMAHAQSEQPGQAKRSETSQIEEIVVTAEKREANLQDVPMAISAVTANRLEQSAVGSTRDLTALVSGLVFTKSISNGMPFIRGVGQTLGDISAESPSAIYVDGVYLMHPASGLFSLGSVERVEVLKGPQGTLFGRNATGGLIHLITKTPSFSASEGKVELGYGSYQTLTASAYGSSPISDNLAANLAVSYENRGEGYGKTLTPGRRFGKLESVSGLSKWVWKPGDRTRVTVDLIADYSKDDAGTLIGTPEGSRPAGQGIGYLGFWTLPVAEPDTPSTRLSLTGSLNIERDLGWARVKNLFAYTRLEASIWPQLLTPGLGTVANTPGFFHLKDSADTYSNELQLQAPAGADFQWVAGVYLLYDHAQDRRFSATTAAAFVARSPLSQDQSSEQKTTSYAVFAQATKTILPDTRLTLGARYTSDKKKVDGEAAIGNFSTYAAGLASVGAPDSKRWGKVTWRASLDHDFTDSIMGYVAASRGFKSGVYNLGSFANPPVNPEVVTLYEVGVKSELFDRHLRLNASLFHQDYKDIQLKSGTMQLCGPAGCTFGTILFNAATSRMRGADVDFEAALGNLTLSGGFEYLDAKFKSFPVAPCTVPRPAPQGGNVTINCDLSGAQMPRAPKFTGNLSATYRVDLSESGELSFAVNDAYNSGFAWDPDGRLRQNAYHLVSASITWRSVDERLTARIWGRNLLNEKIMANVITGGSDLYYPDLPFTAGVSVGVKF